MLLVRDKNDKIHCAICYCALGKNEVVKDRFLPSSCSYNIPPTLNYIGVCAECHKQRSKVKVRLPKYWKHLNQKQVYNLSCFMRNVRSRLLHEDMDENTREEIKRL